VRVRIRTLQFSDFFTTSSLKKNRFDLVKFVFPIRGHSYLECKRNMSPVNSNLYTETPDAWREVLLTSRTKPSPFTVVDCEKYIIFQNWTEHLETYYSKICSLKTRPVKVIEFRRLFDIGFPQRCVLWIHC